MIHNDEHTKVTEPNKDRLFELIVVGGGGIYPMIDLDKISGLLAMEDGVRLDGPVGFE
jgi:hypothetical protein